MRGTCGKSAQHARAGAEHPGTVIAPVLGMDDSRVALLANIASNVVALAMLLACWRWKNAGRLLYVALFLWAAIANLHTARTAPEMYVGFAPYAIGPYRHFITGFFAAHVASIVSAIAVGQFAIALLLSLRGEAVRIGLVGAIVFLLAIAPLGRASAFPCTLILALGAHLLRREWFERTVPEALVEFFRIRAKRTAP